MKSDDVNGRVKTYEAIIKGDNIPQPGIPESFKVLLKELQSLALDVTVLDEDGNEIMMYESDSYNDDDDLKSLIEGDKVIDDDPGLDDVEYRELDSESEESVFDDFDNDDE